jgi:drug/metabolite transporter (DMT)-like permease
VAALLALASALTFGVSDVAGAVAARRASALTVTLGIQLSGAVVLVPLLAIVPGAPSWRAIAVGAAAGAVGNVGLLLYLRCMALGPIGVISPIAALLGAGVPVAWGVAVLGDGLGTWQRVGVLLGLAAVVAVAYVPGTSIRAAGSRGPLAAVAAGVAFGLFFVILSASPDGSGLWPLVGSRASGTAVAVVMLVVRKRPAHPGPALRLTLIAGVTDVVANGLFLFATREGLLSLVSLLTSLYPVVALLVARLWLHERLSRLQAGGVALALLATALLTV